MSAASLARGWLAYGARAVRGAMGAHDYADEGERDSDRDRDRDRGRTRRTLATLAVGALFLAALLLAGMAAITIAVVRDYSEVRARSRTHARIF